MTDFMDVFKNIKNKKHISEKTSLGMPTYPIKTVQMSKKAEAQYREKNKKHPISLSVDISFNNSVMFKKALDARNEIETHWNKFGNWIGHGSSVGKNGSMDIQVCFKETDIDRAKSIAKDIMKKHGVHGKFSEFNVLE
jgi:hypothetical protein